MRALVGVIVAVTLSMAVHMGTVAAQSTQPQPQTPVCYTNTSLGFVVDTSQSTDIVSNTMQQALDNIGDNNGAVLSFQEYYLSTWKYAPHDVKPFDTITELTDFFGTSGIGNTRINIEPPPKHDDWAYMIESLYEQVLLASDHGMIVVLGDQDELCDGRPYDGSVAHANCWYCGMYDNTQYNAKLAQIVQIAQAKHVTISFYYFITVPWNADTNGCPASGQFSREIAMGLAVNVSTATGGQALFASGLAEAMATEIKVKGKIPAVCPGCADDATLAIVVDTSGNPATVAAQVGIVVQKLQTAHTAGTLRPFNKYVLASWAAAPIAVASYNTFGDLVDAIQLPGFYADLLSVNDPVSAQQGNDWRYLILTLKEIVNHVGIGGYIVAIDDEEAFCDPYKYNGDPLGSKLWAHELQQFINAAVARKVQFSWYQFANGFSLADGAVCTSAGAQPLINLAHGRADATAHILAGEAILGIPIGDTAQPKHIADSIIAQSQRPPCSNCTLNATLAFIVDTSDSSVELKQHHYKTWFAEIATAPLPSQLASFTGGFDLNTWQQAYNEILHYGSVPALNTWVQGAALAANRVTQDVPKHDHDDWRYMLENLPLTVQAVDKSGVVIIIADDNQICDAGMFGHNSSEPNFVSALSAAQQLGVAISYFQFATTNRWCTDAQMAVGHGLATLLAQQTGGVYYFGTDASNAARNADFDAHVVPTLQAAGARPVCPQTCPPDSVWVRDRCILINPCDVHPCMNGATCVPELNTPRYTCTCTDDFYGVHCEQPCVPHSFDNKLAHALGVVVDTSDSTGYALSGVASAIASVLSASGAFDQYLLSTWAYVAPTLVHQFTTPAALQTELATLAGLAKQNHRIDADVGQLKQHDDWRYMLDSVDAILPMLGDDGVLVVLTDLEGVCDASESARVWNGVTRYPGNPQLARILTQNQAARDHNIKVFFVTFPSSDQNFGYCNSTQKLEGYGAALALVDQTDGQVADFPAFNSAANAAIASAALADIVTDQSVAKRCNCPPPYVFSPQDNVCKL